MIMFQIVIQVGDELDGMVVIRNGDNRQGVCPLKFLQEVWHRHLTEKLNIEGQTHYPIRNSTVQQFNSTSITGYFNHTTAENGQNNNSKNNNITNTTKNESGIFINRLYWHIDYHSNITCQKEYSKFEILTRNRFASYPQANTQNRHQLKGFVAQSISVDTFNTVDYDVQNISESNGEHNNHTNINSADNKSSDLVWYIDNKIINVSNSNTLCHNNNITKTVLPIPSSIRPLGLPSLCSSPQNQFYRPNRRFRYRNIKNVTSLSRPLIIG